MAIDLTGSGIFDSFLGSSSSTPPTATPTFWPSSSAFPSLEGITKTVADVTSGLANTWNTVQNAQLDMAAKKASIAESLASISIQKTNAQTAAQIAKIQASNALKQAQGNANNIGQWNADGINNALANLAGGITAGNNANKTMLMLTVVGVGIAALQFLKKRG